MFMWSFGALSLNFVSPGECLGRWGGISEMVSHRTQVLQPGGPVRTAVHI